MTRSAKPRVAIDVRMADTPGIGTYLKNLVPRVIAARPDWKFTLLGAPKSWTQATAGNVRFISLGASIYTVREQLALLSAGGPFDAFWSPHYNIPVLSRSRLLVTVHDLIHLARPEYTRSFAKRSYARVMFDVVRRKATAIVTVSQFTRDEFVRIVGEPRAPIFVASNGVDARWFEPRAGARSAGARPYVISVGSLKPHKNLGALIAAFATLLERIPHDLVIAGPTGGFRTPDRTVFDAVAGLGDRVRFAGKVSDAELRALVAGASALIHPSLYEGFGLPPLEAMAAGCPCLVSALTSLPEVCGDAAVYCDPRDPADIAARLYGLINDEALQRDLVERGRARAATFEWSRAADTTLRALEHTIGS